LVSEVGKLGKIRDPSEPIDFSNLIDPGDRLIVSQLSQNKQKVVLALNKIDLCKDKRLLLPLLTEWGKLRDFAAMVPVCANSGERVDALLAELRATLPLGPPLYPADMLTDSPERSLVAERVREQIFHATFREVPYATAVSIESWEERSGVRRGKRRDRQAVVISATIHVEKLNQKKILIGEGGATLRAIGTAARQDIEQLLGCPVFLELFVRVAPEWSRSPAGLRQMGYHPSDSRGG
jgi:GTP-binding protein Era